MGSNAKILQGDSCSALSLLYNGIVQQVVNEARKLFSEENIDEAVIQKLEETWINKLIKSSEENIHELKTDLISTDGIIGKTSNLNLSINANETIKIYAAPDQNANALAIFDSKLNEASLHSLPKGSDNESLNSEDDIHEDDMKTNNIIVCQYKSVKRRKNLWKMNLHSGLMNLDGEQYALSSAYGEAKF